MAVEGPCAGVHGRCQHVAFQSEQQLTHLVVGLRTYVVQFFLEKGAPGGGVGNAAGEMFGSRRLETALNDYGDAPPDVLIGGVRQAVRDFAQEAPQFDDITMLALKYHGLPVYHEDQNDV